MTLEMKILDSILDHTSERFELLTQYLENLKDNDPDKLLKQTVAGAGLVELKMILALIKERIVLENFER